MTSGVRDRASSSLSTPAHAAAASVHDPLLAGGEMGALMRSIDWSTTALGPVASWPVSLRTLVSTALNSRFAMMVWWGPEHVMLYNDAYRVMLGEKHPHAMGQPGHEVWTEIWPIIGPMLDGVLATGTPTWSENQALLLERHGFLEEAYFTFSYSAIYNQSGGIGGVLNVVTDTTSEVLDARRLHTLQQVAAQTVGTTSVRAACASAMQAVALNAADLPFALLYLVDDAGREARFERQCGLCAGAAVGPARIALDVPGDDGWPLAEVVLDGRSRRVDALEARFGALPMLEGRPAPGAAWVLPVIRPLGHRPAALLVVGLSPRLQHDSKYSGFLELVAGSLSAALASAQAYEEETRRAEQLAELDRSKTAFFSNVSHEFRTPLTLMLAPLEDSLADQLEPLPPRQRERQLLIRRNGLRLQKLVNTLLDFARIEAGRAQISFVPTDLSALTRELVSSFDSALTSAGLKLVVDCPELQEPVYVDPAMWEKVVFNLLSNSLKFTFQGEVRVALRWTGPSVDLSVSDTGTGIPSAELPRVFERFHRVEGARGRSHEGTGIGLALVQELTRMHGGSVSVSSELARGTTFTVSIPTGRAHIPEARIGEDPRTRSETEQVVSAFLADAEYWSEARHPSSMPPKLPREGHLPGLPTEGARVLIADDNADMRGYLSRLLSPFWEVETVSDGLRALAIARAAPPSMIISDVSMPGMDGLSFVRALRADERTRTIPVMLLSARAGEDATIEGLRSGADEYLVKPFSANELMARVHAQLTVSQLRREAMDGERAHTDEARRLLAESRRATQLREETLAVVSHDLRTPLTAIKMSVELIQLALTDSERDQKLRKQSESIKRSVTRMNRLISDLLDLASIETGTLSLETRHHRVDELLHEVQEVFAAQAEKKGLTLEAEVEPDLPLLEADKERLLQVLCNLLANALQFTPHGGKVRVRASSRPPGVLFAVSDTGRGIASDELPHIFDRYWHSTLHGRESHGLGLSIATGIVEAHGGTLEVESEQGRGSTFSFVLPALGSETRGCEKPPTRVRPKLESQRPAWPESAPEDAPVEPAPVRELLTSTQMELAQVRSQLAMHETRQADLEAALRARDEFLAVASHELRTPVTALALQIESLSPRRIGELSAEALRSRSEGLTARMRRLTRQVSDLVEVAKLLTAPLQLQRSSVELSTVLTGVFEELRDDALRAHSVVTLDVRDGATGDYDQSRLHHAFVQLLDNALKFGAGKPVEVSIETCGESLCVRFVDHGVGIAPDSVARVFERFQRDVSAANYGGFGLGLWSAREIVQAHGGSIDVSDTEGGGATLTVRLPRQP